MATPGKSSTLQRLLFAALVVAFVYVLINRFDEIQKLAGTLARGKWQWIAAAAVLQFLYYVGYAALFKTAFQLIGIRTRLQGLIPISFAAVFVTSTMPSGATGGLALFVDDIRRRGQSAARATAGTILVQTANIGVFAILLILGLFFLFLHGGLSALEVTSSLFLFVMVAALLSLLGLGLWRREWLERLLGGVQRLVNRVVGWIRRPPLLPQGWAARNTQDFTAASRALGRHPGRLLRVLAVALAVHAINILSLYCIFLAFSQPATARALVVGYTMSVLFAIVSPTPNGIGVVEGIVPIIYRSMGIPLATGTVITLAFRGLSFWLPMLIGFVLLRQLKMFTAPERELAEAGQARILAMLTALMGVLNILSAIRPSLLEPIEALNRFTPLALLQGGQVTAVVTGFLLLILARGLWRHKRMALLLTLIVLSISILGQLLRTDYVTAILAALLALFLVAQRSHFHALSDEPSAWQGLQVLGIALIITLVYGTIGFYVLDRRAGEEFDMLAAWGRTLLLFTGSSDPFLRPNTTLDYFVNSIYIVGIGTLLYAVSMLLRPVLLRAPAGEQERQRAQEIVDRYGRSPLSNMALLPDKSYYFSSGGSLVAYALDKRTAVALGDPIGPEEDTLEAIHGFREFCLKRDWQAAFYRALPDYLEDYRTVGFQAAVTGKAALVDLATLDAGNNTSAWRETVQLLSSEGYRALVYQPPFSPELLERLRLVSDEWLSSARRQEQRFAQGHFSRPHLSRGLVVALITPSGEINAFVSALSDQERQEIMVDLLRYRQAVGKNHLVFLLASLAVWAKQRGFKTLNLGLSLTPDAEQKQPAYRLVERLAEPFFAFLNQPSSADGLDDLKEQFTSTWEPRYLIYPGPASLPAIWSALARVTSASYL